MFSDTRLGVWVSLGMDIAGGPVWRLQSSDWASNVSSTSQPPKRHAGSSLCQVEVDGGVNTGKKNLRDPIDIKETGTCHFHPCSPKKYELHLAKLRRTSQGERFDQSLRTQDYLRPFP